MDEPTCSNCGLPKNQWMENSGEGYRRDDVTYCSRDCAEIAEAILETAGHPTAGAARVTEKRRWPDR